jgi:GAF domain-containing protein
LVAALGDWPGECLVQPVFLGEKPVAFLYVSSPSPGSFSASDLAYVRGLCDAASVALANAIRLKKEEI